MTGASNDVLRVSAGNNILDGGSGANFFYNGAPALQPGHNVYIADAYNNRIRKVDTSGVITTFAGTGTAAQVEVTRQDTGQYLTAAGTWQSAETAAIRATTTP